MSSKAFLAELKTREDGKWSFNWTHSCIPFMLEDFGYRLPLDNGGMGLPVIIFREQLEIMTKADPDMYLGYVGRDKIKEHLDTIEQDMGNKHFVIYYCV